MHPFLLVKLPEFVFDILNTHTIDANSRCPPIGKCGRKMSRKNVRSWRSLLSIDCDITNVTLTAILANRTLLSTLC